MSNKIICFECGTTNDVQQHHVIPRSLGGTKTIPLCLHCHRLAHGITKKPKNSHSSLVRLGLDKRRQSGKTLGRPNGSSKSDQDILKQYPAIVKQLKAERSIRETAKLCDVANGTVVKVKQALKNDRNEPR
mgnify:FL=1